MGGMDGIIISAKRHRSGQGDHGRNGATITSRTGVSRR